jgi:hypothetical protein
VLKRLIPLSISLLLLTPGPQGQSQRGSGIISGMVVDEHGSPVPAAEVDVDAEDGRVRSKARRFVETDSEGRFSIDGLQWGKYRVFAKKESSGYPDMAFPFYSTELYPVASVIEYAPTAHVQIRFGPKAGTLEGHVTNAETGSPLNAGFKLIRAADPESWLSISAPPVYRVLLPSDVDIQVEVSAPGFKTWMSSKPLRLQAGTEVSLDVALMSNTKFAHRAPAIE